MTELKYSGYVLWIKWMHRGWAPYIHCITLPLPSRNPRQHLIEYATKKLIGGWWKRGKTWMVLPNTDTPKS